MQIDANYSIIKELKKNPSQSLHGSLTPLGVPPKY